MLEITWNCGSKLLDVLNRLAHRKAVLENIKEIIVVGKNEARTSINTYSEESKDYLATLKIVEQILLGKTNDLIAKATKEFSEL